MRPPPEFLDAGTLETDFGVSYAPAVDVNRVPLIPPQSSLPGDSANTVPHSSPGLLPGGQVGPGVQHTFLAPVPHVALIDSEAGGVTEVDAGDAIDKPSCRSLSGSIIILTLTMLVVSLFVCLARPDFNFVLYLLGYSIWCLESVHHAFPAAVIPGRYPRASELRVATKQMISSVEYYNFLLGGAILLDMSWVYLASSAWLCMDDAAEKCFEGPGSEQTIVRVNMTSWMHQFSIFGSTVNIVGKITVMVLSVIWLLQQKRHRKNLSEFSSDI